MCTYNGEKYLQAQLDSIASQTRLPDELIICDDNSSDRTINIINDFAASTPFPVTLHINGRNIGSTKNFEHAIGFCNSDITVLSDQDDVWHSDKLELVEKTFLMFEKNAGGVFTNGNVVDDNLSPLGYTLWDTHGFTKKYKSDFMAGKAFETLLNRNIITGATFAFQTKLRDLFMPIPDNWVHDEWIAILISMQSRIIFLDRCLIEYRQHDKQQIGSAKNNLFTRIASAISVDSYNPDIHAYEQLIQHLEHLRITDKNYFTGKITDKVRHLHARNSIYDSNLFNKISIIKRELLSKRYYYYSSGYLSAIKDLLYIKRKDR